MGKFQDGEDLYENLDYDAEENQPGIGDDIRFINRVKLRHDELLKISDNEEENEGNVFDDD